MVRMFSQNPHVGTRLPHKVKQHLAWCPRPGCLGDRAPEGLGLSPPARLGGEGDKNAAAHSQRLCPRARPPPFWVPQVCHMAAPGVSAPLLR